MRKKSAQRKAHIFAAAKKLFETQGYEHTSVDQIVKEAGVAKGTFYYYFESKEEALDAMIEDLDQSGTAIIQPVLDQTDIPADQKLRLALIALRQHYAGSKKLLSEYHSLKDELLYYKSMARSVQVLTIPFTQIIQQGIEEGIFKTDFPVAISESILTSAHFLLDGEIFPTDENGWLARLQVTQLLLERGLQAAPNTLDFTSDWRSAYNS